MAVFIGSLVMEARCRMYKGRGISQEELAGMVGVSRTYICKIESNTFVPGDELCVRLAEVLGLDVRMLRRMALERRTGIKIRDLVTYPETKCEEELIELFRKLEEDQRDRVMEFILEMRDLPF